MDFSARMDKIVEISKLSIGKIEDKCGISNATLREAVKDNRFPTDKIIEKLISGMRISRDWWETGKGEVFEKGNQSPDKNPTDELEKLKVYKDLVEAQTDYRLIPKRILDDYKIVPDKIIDIIIQSNNKERQAVEQNRELEIKNLNKHYEIIIDGLERQIVRLEKEKDDLLRQVPTKNQ